MVDFSPIFGYTHGKPFMGIPIEKNLKEDF